MANELSYIVFETKRGWIGILASKAGLVSVTLPQRNRQQAVDAMGKQAQTAILSTDSFIELEDKFKHYYSGERTTFADKLDFSNATVFQRYVWEATRLIPYGETQSYGWVARQIGRPKAVRAVGQALGKNPFIIIVPCHRVIAGDGKLGGFGGGREMKKTLLELEKTPRKKS